MLKNKRFAGETVVTIFGRVEYDDEGVTTDLTLEQAKTFEGIPGYEILEDTFQDKDKEEKQEPEQEVEKPEKDNKKELEKKPVKKPKKYSKTALKNKTVAEIEDIAKEKGIELQGAVKKEKIKEVLEAQ